MTVSRFAVYFFALAACSTIAFATGLAGNVETAQASAVTYVSPPHPGKMHAHMHLSPLLFKTFLIGKFVHIAHTN